MLLKFKIIILSVIAIVCICNYNFAQKNLELQIRNCKLVTEYADDTLVDNMDTVTFGSYQQSDVTGKTKDPIEWIVLDRDEENKKALLLSKYILDCKPYDDNFENLSWDTCTLRKWLNNDFYNNSFNKNEKDIILLSKVINTSADGVEWANGVTPNNTNDKVFLLCIDEIKDYFGNGVKDKYGYYIRKNLLTYGTNYAKTKDLINEIVEERNQYSNEYWLRTNYGYDGRIQTSGFRGEIDEIGYWPDDLARGIRPAIWVNYNVETEAQTNINNNTTMLQNDTNESEINKDLERLYETWDDNMFDWTSYQYSHKVARISAMLSEAAYTESKIESLLLNEFKFSKVKFYNYNYPKSMKIGYDGTNCFSVAHKNVGDSAIVVISARGTKEFAEMLGDAFKYDFINGQYLHNMNNVAVYDHVYDFYEQIKIGVENYFIENSNLKKVKNLKILITGHSFGGASANCYAADLIANIKNNNLNTYLEKNSIFTYTFGAIKVFDKRLDQNIFDTISNYFNGVPNYSEGYMNIFNIYNHYDSFGSNGNYAWTKASAPQQKFGLTYEYKDERLHFEEINESHLYEINSTDVITILSALIKAGKHLKENATDFVGTFNNHNMTNYMAALNLYDYSNKNTMNNENGSSDLPSEIYTDNNEVHKSEKTISNNNQVAKDIYYYYFDDKNSKILHLTSKNIAGKTREVKTIKPRKNYAKYYYFYGDDTVPFKGGNPIAYKYSDEIDNVINVETIVIDDNLKLDSTAYMFSGFKKLKEVNANLIDTSETLYMKRMFANCESIIELDIGLWKTDQVIDMSYMFASCSSLTYLDLSKWNMHSVKSLECLFFYCSLLNNIDVSNWDVLNVENVEGMFFSCDSLEYLDVSKWNIKSVKNLTYMFSGCSSLKTIDVSKWDTSKVTSMNHTFNMCASLLELNVSNWNTSSVTIMNGIFKNCSSLVEIDVSKWDTSQVIDMSSMFEGCSSLVKLDVKNWDTSKVNSMSGTFAYCSLLTELDVHGWDVSNVTIIDLIFAKSPGLKKIDVSKWNLNKAVGVGNMFGN